MRVMIHALSARRGGGQTYLLNLLSRLDDFPELDVYLLAPKSLALSPHSRLQRLSAPTWTGNPLLRAAWERVVLPRIFRRLRPDILFCPGGLITVTVPKGCRTVTMFRNMIPFDPAQRRKYPLGAERLRNWVLEHLLLRSMLRADLVIFLSDHARRVIASRVGNRIAENEIIPHGLSDDFRAPREALNARPGYIPDGTYLLYVSPFHVYKNQLEVVQGYALLRERRETPEMLVLAGPLTDSPYGIRVRQEITRLGLETHVRITGGIPYEELPALYRHARVNLFASESENCPNILLEALGSGRPVLASSRPPMPEFAAEAALYFDPASPDQLCDRLLEILDDEQRLAKFGKLAWRRSLEFSWDRTAKRTWNAICELHQVNATLQ